MTDIPTIQFEARLRRLAAVERLRKYLLKTHRHDWRPIKIETPHATDMPKPEVRLIKECRICGVKQ